ncbi:MAG: single-stranded-DNA-specific exonuclease RecJ [Pelagibacterales bacterium]|nr:single-stranded-DNA-specific exonuclease RecJ [Pelagibacterales bacterium]
MQKVIYKRSNLSASGLIWKHKKNLSENYKILEKSYFLSNIVKNLLLKRDLFSMEISDYLNPSLRRLTPDPSILHDMEKAVNEFYKAIVKKEKIGILGDYDVDGATSSALIFNYLKELKINYLDVFIPDREKDGYGISENAVKFFSKKKTKLILCLDCGTNDINNIKKAEDLGIKVIIIDHHEQKTQNKSLALINPKKSKDKSGLDYLATVGLSFLFIIALNRSLKKNFYFNESLIEPKLKKYLDLVALGTICDLVPLKKVNRLFVKKGILELNKKKNKGIVALTEKLNIDKTIDVSDIGFYLGPCINAPGRIGDSSLGFKILSSEDESTSSELANILLKNNKERKTLEDIVCEQAKKKFLITKKNNNKIKHPNFILVHDQNWHPGIIGIIASRLTKEYNLPSIVISLKESNSKGSIRSIIGVNASDIIEFLKEKNCIINGGGHKMAGGFSLKKANLSKIKSMLESYFSRVTIKNQNFLEIDTTLDLQSINTSLIEKIKDIGPFGNNNEEPIIVLNNLKPTFIKRVGKFKNHVFCVLEDIYGKTINAIAFNHATTAIGRAILRENIINVAGKLEINKYEKKNNTQFIIEDILIL